MARTIHKRSSLWALSLFLTVSIAATVQDDWLYPLRPDNATLLVVGQTYTLKWTSRLWTWFSVYAPSIDVYNADLWVTGFSQHQYQHLVASSVNVNGSGYSLTWKAQVPDNEFDSTQSWVLRFVPSGVTPAQTTQQISSPGFYLIKPAAVASSSTVSSASSATTAISVTSATQASTTTAIPASTNTSTPNSEPTHAFGLSSGAIGGIVAGTVVGTALLIALGWTLARSRKTKNRSSQHEFAPGSSPDDRSYPEAVPMQEKRSAIGIAQMHAAPPGYNQGYGQHTSFPAELDHSHRDYAMHELSASPDFRR